MAIFKKQPEKAPAELYRQCNELPIHNFNEISTNGDYDYLKKNRNDDVPVAELDKVWYDILDEFLRISKNKIANGILRKKKELIFLYKRLDILEAIKTCIDYEIDVTDKCKEYRVTPKNIDARIGLVKNDIMRITNSLSDKEGQTQDPGETDFDRSIAQIMRAGYPINRFKTVVTEWCAILNLLEENKSDNT